MTEQSETDLYRYPLSSPLTFQAGDILGYYQSEEHLQFIFQEVDLGYPVYYYASESCAVSQMTLSLQMSSEEQYRLLIGIETGKGQYCL